MSAKEVMQVAVKVVVYVTAKAVGSAGKKESAVVCAGEGAGVGGGADK